MSVPTTILLAVFDLDLRRTLAEVLTDDNIELVGVADDFIDAVQGVIAHSPRIVVVEDCPAFPWTQLCNYVWLAAPGSWVVLISDAVTDQTIDTAMLLGVRRVLPRSEAPSGLLDTMRRLEGLEAARDAEEYIKATDPLRCARVISISGAKGGVGKTTLAVNLGVALASLSEGGVVLWDAYCQFGDVANMMGISSARPLVELVGMGEDVDTDMILSCLVHHDTGIDVLMTSENPAPLDTLSEPFVDRVLKALRSKYRFIVIDTPPIIHPISSLAFAACWRLLLLITLRDVIAISDAMKLLQLLEPKHVRAESVRMVSNRVAKGDSVHENEVESLTSKKLIGNIPEDPAVTQANNLGVPVVKMSARSPASRAIAQLAQHLLEEASTF